MSKKIKILFIHHGVGINGAFISLLSLIKQLDKEKYSISVLMYKGDKPKQILENIGIQVIVVDAKRLLFSHHKAGLIAFYSFYKYIPIIIHWMKIYYLIGPRILNKNKYDLIHLNSHVLTSWGCAAKKLGYKVVYHNQEAIAHGFFGIRKKILQKLISLSANKIINISKDNYYRLGIFRKSAIVYNYSIVPQNYRKPFSVKAKDRKVLFLGGMAEIKGFGTVVKCLPYLDKFIIIQFAGYLGKINNGSGIKGILKTILKKTLYRKTYLPLYKIDSAENAEVLGLLKDPLQYIDACDILVTPFKVEHFSRPAVEAFAYGKPVIGSDVEGMDEIIDHGVNGLLVEKENPKALAEAINYLCANPEVAIEMGKKGREKAKTVFSPDINTKKVEKIYTELMSTES